MTAEILRRAADRIESLAGEASPGPWTWELREDWGWGEWHTITSPTSGHDVASGGYEGGGVEREEDAVWISTLGPQIAVPLVEILRDAAFELDGGDDEDRYEGQVKLARLILGEQP
jgi:hypothetical protein